MTKPNVRRPEELALGWPLMKSKRLHLELSTVITETKSRTLQELMKEEEFHIFQPKTLSEATNRFSSENLIGEGGCNFVYRGSLRNGRRIAVKVPKEGGTGFLEMKIMQSLNHRYITPLVGACALNKSLTLVYELSTGANLEESLEKGLTWDARYSVAVSVCEALHHMHRRAVRPVIHRDVKSSNILLSRELLPQLSDFGFATWGPAANVSEVVGTFGYIPPEYIMYGRISEKTDVYAFGVVLLELLTGRKAISSEGNESLVKWAIRWLAKGEYRSVLDRRLGEDADGAEVRGMFLGAILCTEGSPRLRPDFCQILGLLRKEQSMEGWMQEYVDGVMMSEDVDDDFWEIFSTSDERNEESF